MAAGELSAPRFVDRAYVALVDRHGLGAALDAVPVPAAPESVRNEAWLAGIWQRQDFERKDLRTTTGLRIQVVYPGWQTGGAGPDFRGAILALDDGSLLRGDVELHLFGAGWGQHGHSLDAAYNDVVLHVVLSATAQAVKANGQPVLTLELGGRLRRRDRVALRPRSTPVPVEPPAAPLQLSYVLAPCKQALPARGQDGLAEQLCRLALDRFDEKATVFEGNLARFNPAQVLYGGLMEALGYSRNQEPFRALVDALSLDTLLLAKSAANLEAVLLEAAGLAPGTGQTPPAFAWPERWPLALDWHTTGVRPDNLPGNRLRQFAAILARVAAEDGLIDALLAPLEAARSATGPVDRRAVAAMRRSWRRTLHEVGPRRADSMAINVVLPFAAAYGQATCQYWLAEAAIEAFTAFPSEGPNQVSTYMRREILGPLAPAADGAAAGQALMHVWKRWCNRKVCSVCPLGLRSRKA